MIIQNFNPVYTLICVFFCLFVLDTGQRTVSIKNNVKSSNILLYKLTANSVTNYVNLIAENCYMPQLPYHGFTFSNGIGRQVKKTVNKRKDLRPHTSDKAPIKGADMKDRNP